MAIDSTPARALHLSVLPPESVARLHAASLRILERTGVFVESPRARDLLREAGANVAGDRVRLPATVVEAALRTAPRRVVIANRGGQPYLHLEDNNTYFTGIVDSIEILDPFTNVRRPFAAKDYEMMARVVDACGHLYGAGAGGCAVDYPAQVGGQVAFKYSIANMTKPFMSCPLDARVMADIYAMAAVIAGGCEQMRAAPFVIATAEPTTPLGLFKDATEILLLAAAEAMPVVWYPMPSAGTTAPCAPAATIAVGNAEVLAGLVLHQSRRPGAPFIYGMMPGMTDLRGDTGQWAYGSPDLALMAAAATDLAHSYGLPMYGTAGCTDAAYVDEQAAAEATTLCLMAKLSGANLVHDVGIMAGDSLISPAMLVLCDEILDMVEHATRGFVVDDAELALDLVDEVGPRGNFLTGEHTLHNFRRFWYSDVFRRVRLSSVAGNGREAVEGRIRAKTLDIIAHHEVEPLPAEVTRELDVLERHWGGGTVA